MAAPKLTARGGPEVEAFLRDLLDEIREAFSAILPEDTYRSAVLIGGYGRGEGGVQMVGGKERPHNNLDLLVVSRAGLTEGMREELGAVARRLSEKVGLGIDVGYVEESRLLRSPCLVMWYDMRFGHRTILGDEGFLPGLERFTVEKVVPSDVLKLMVNRGTLLVINDLLLENPNPTEKSRALIVKHVMKAIIGFGDAFLFSRGEYDWSYLEKQRRMRAVEDAPEGLQKLYDGALEFRFSPDYAAFESRDLRAWAEELRTALEPVFLDFERHRLDSQVLGWDGYLRAALGAELRRDRGSPRGLAMKLVFGLCESGLPGFGIAARCAGPRQIVPLLFPAVYFGVGEEEYREAARAFLGSPTADAPSLRRAYLRRWGELGDANFSTVVETHGIDLEAPGFAP